MQKTALVFSFLFASNIVTLWSTLYGGGLRKLKDQATIFKHGQKKPKMFFCRVYTDIKPRELIVKEKPSSLGWGVPYIIFWIKEITRKGSYTFFKYINLSKYFKIFVFVIAILFDKKILAILLVTAGKAILKESCSGRQSLTG